MCRQKLSEIFEKFHFCYQISKHGGGLLDMKIISLTRTGFDNYKSHVDGPQMVMTLLINSLIYETKTGKHVREPVN